MALKIKSSRLRRVSYRFKLAQEMIGPGATDRSINCHDKFIYLKINNLSLRARNERGNRELCTTPTHERRAKPFCKVRDCRASLAMTKCFVG